jgi:hypothetical protein
MKKSELEKHICSTLKLEELTPTIKKQITKFVIQRGFKYEDIAHAITFYTEVEQNEFEKKFGIAFVEWTVDKANAYHKKLENRKQQQLNSIKKSEEKTNIILKVTKMEKRQSIPKVDIEKIED